MKKAFIKYYGGWGEETDKSKILDADECVFADTIEEAVEYINLHYNEAGQEFDIVEPDISWKADKEKGRIKRTQNPNLKPTVNYITAITLMKEHGTIYTKNCTILAKLWTEQSEKSLLELGIIKSWDNFRYDPEEAKKELARIRRRKIYKPVEKKHFIRIDQISKVNYSMTSEVNKQLKVNSYNTRLEFNDYFYGGRKAMVCKRFLSLIELLSTLLGKYSYRQLEQFQILKKEWKKQKPKSHTSTGVSKYFFNFMEKETKKRKPKQRELKIKWIKI